MIKLEDVDKVESLNRTDFYKLITGNDTVDYKINSTTVIVKKSLLKPKNMDIVMTLVDKFRKGHSEEGYYTGPCDKIADAYKLKDYKLFKQEVLELLVNIQSD